MSEIQPHPAPIRPFLAYFLKLGTLGFGGPIALAGAMHRDLVEARGWVSEADYQEGLTLAQVSPGPLAAQLAIYLGYVRAGILGANLVGIAFILPSFLMVLALAALYLRFGGLPWMQAAFYGVGAAVIGLMAATTVQLLLSGVASLGSLLLFIVALFALFRFKSALVAPAVVLGAAAVGAWLF